MTLEALTQKQLLVLLIIIAKNNNVNDKKKQVQLEKLIYLCNYSYIEFEGIVEISPIRRVVIAIVV